MNAAMETLKGKIIPVLDDGHILTAYTNWLAGSVIIRWRPEA